MSLFQRATKETFHLGIFIGTGSVDALFYALRPGRKPRIVDVFLRPHSLIPTSDFKALQAYIEHELQDIARALAPTLAGIHFSSVHVLLASPWYFSQTRIVTIKKKEAFEIHKAFLALHLMKEKEAFLSDARSRFSDDEDTYHIVEMSCMRMLMNGYEVNDFLHKKAREVTFDMYMSMSLKKFIEGITHALESHFAPGDIVFHSAPFVFFKALKQFWHHHDAKSICDVDEGVVLVDIGGEVTDITVIRKGIIEETFSFGKGLHFIIRRIASANSLSPKEALSLFRSWERDELAHTKKEKINALVARALTEWAAQAEQTLRDASGNVPLPAALILAGEGAHFSGFAKALAGKEFLQYIFERKPFRITVFEPQQIRAYFEGPTAVFAHGPKAASLYLLAVPVEITSLS